jgi:hypothetical protein
VDDRLEDWKRANGVAGEVAWKGTWVGPEDQHMTHHAAAKARRTGADADDELQQIDRIISASGASDFDGFFRPAARSRRR